MLSDKSANLSFGQIVKQHRKLLGLSRKELAERTGCSAVTIVKIESGERRPSKQIAELLAKGLEIPIGQQPTFVEHARIQGRAGSSEELPEDEEIAAPTVAAVKRPVSNLPAPPTSFIGHETSIEEAQELLSRPGVRLLTFTGPPGIGKTRLSLRVAEELLSDFADGAFFVELAPVRDPDLLVPAIAQALSVRESVSIPVLEKVKKHLMYKSMLLVLDNFEQIIEAASVVGELLQSAPGLKIIVSSREILHIYGEHDFPVPPLSLPEIEAPAGYVNWLGYETIRLFVERSVASKRVFTLTDENAPAIVEICRRLDCLPLAIELAAAHIRAFAPEEILSRLESRLALLMGGPRDLPKRQQALRHAIDWSYDLLNEAERALFRRISVFRGGCTFDAVSAVCLGDDGHAPEGNSEEIIAGAPNPQLDVLESLVDKSLLRSEPVGDTIRFWMLETIREYALEKLVEAGEAEEVQQRHADYYLTLSKEAQPHMKGPGQTQWLDKLERDHQNLRAALEWSSASDRGALTGLKMATALWRFWEIRGYLSEGRKWLLATLALPKAAERTQARASALRAAGRLALLQADYGSARTLYEESLSISEESEDKPAISSALFNLGFVAFDQGDYATARARYEAALPLLSEMGDTHFMAGALYSLGNMSAEEEEYNLASERYGESLRLYQVLGDQHGIGNALLGLGELARTTGDYARAHTLNIQALHIWEELGHKLNIALTLHNLGYVAQERCDLVEAVGLFCRAMKIYRELGDNPGLAECLAGLASLAISRIQPERAVRLLAAASSLMESVGYSLSATERREYEQSLSAARIQLSPNLFEQVWAEGHAVPVDQAVKYALDADFHEDQGAGLNHGTN